MWQDFVLTGGSIIFVIALVPSVLGRDKPALSTSLMTGTVLAVFAYIYLTLSLWFSAITTILTCLIWFTLAWQKHSSSKKS